MFYALSMNLAFIGFGVTGLIFLFYATSLYKLTSKTLPVVLKSYCYAYFSLALGFILWAIAAVIPEFLNPSIVVGDILILIGSVLLLNVLFEKNSSLKFTSLIVLSLISILFIYLRLTILPPQAVIDNGILIFNTQPLLSKILSLIFLVVWLPTNIRAANLITSAMKVPQLNIFYGFIYAFSTVSAILLMSFKTAPMIIAAFIALSICFVLLLYSNYIITKFITDK